MDREEHIARCKERALAELNAGQLAGAVSSMIGDLASHPETRSPAYDILAEVGLMEAMSGDPEKVRRWIDGFN